jgi:hypothetical protein
MLKLAALDEDDLRIVSAHVQDAVVKSGDIRFDQKAGRLLVEMNRFVWERKPRFIFRERFERRRSVLHFDGVRAVQANGISPHKAEEALVLLSIGFEAGGEAPAGTVALLFAGGHGLRLQVDYIEARLTDLGAAWEAQSRPRHFA